MVTSKCCPAAFSLDNCRTKSFFGFNIKNSYFNRNSIWNSWLFCSSIFPLQYGWENQIIILVVFCIKYCFFKWLISRCRFHNAIIFWKGHRYYSWNIFARSTIINVPINPTSRRWNINLFNPVYIIIGTKKIAISFVKNFIIKPLLLIVIRTTCLLWIFYQEFFRYLSKLPSIFLLNRS